MNELDVVLFFPCEEAAINVDMRVADLAYGWWEIKRPLKQVYMPAGYSNNYPAPDVNFFFSVIGGMGPYDLFIEMHSLDLLNPKRNRFLKRSDAFRIDCPNESVVVESVITLEDVVFPNPGWYRFQLKSQGQLLNLGSSRSEFFLQVFAGEGS